MGGFRVALAIQLGALLGDLAYALLAVAGVGRVLTHPATQVLLGVAGTGLLMALGWSALSGWRGIAVVAAATTVGVPIQAPQACDDPWRRAWAGLALALANPCGPAFWIAVGNAVAPYAGHHGVAWLSGFGTGALLASLAIALLVGCGRSYLTALRMRVAASICGLALIASGLGLGCATVLSWQH
jgi:threonine/homoserine/homoserine lactone efflux protein